MANTNRRIVAADTFASALVDTNPTSITERSAISRVALGNPMARFVLIGVCRTFDADTDINVIIVKKCSEWACRLGGTAGVSVVCVAVVSVGPTA